MTRFATLLSIPATWTVLYKESYVSLTPQLSKGG